MVALALRLPARHRDRDGRGRGRLPATGITPVICGDAHLGNFGFYASPERDLVIDLNDFDEAHPGAWEWDLRRLVASIWVAGRQNVERAAVPRCGRSCVAAYRAEVRFLAEQPLLTRSYHRLDVERLHETATEKSLRGRDRARREAGPQPHQRPRAAALHPGARGASAHRRRAAADHPRLRAGRRAIAAALDEYLTTLAPHWRRALGGYTLVDIAHKVVGVGSVGLRAYVALLEGSSPDDVVFLQLKQARRSVLAELRARRLGLARPPGPAGGRVPAGAADGQRPAARAGPRWTSGSTTCASSAT